MVPSGPPTPLGGAQSVPSSLLRSNSGLMGGQGGSVNSQSGFPSVNQRNQFNSMNMLGNVANVSSLLHQSFGNGGPSSALSGPGNTQRGLIDNGSETDPLSSVGNGMGFNPSSSSFSVSNIVNPNSSGQVQGQQFSNNSGNQMFSDQQGQQHESQNFQHNQVLQQFSAPNNNHQQQQMHYQSIRGGMSGIGPVKLEPQMTNDQNGQSSQQLQSLQNLGPVKLEPQQMQTMRGLAPVKMEAQHSDQSLSSGENFLPSILLQMPRKNGVFPCMEVDVKLPEFFPDLKMHAPDPAHSEDSADPAHSETAKTKKRKKLAGGKVRKDRCGACIGNKQACRDNCICREFFPGDAMTAYKAGQIQTLFHRKGMTLLLASCDPSAVSTCINTMYRTCNLLVNDPVQGPIGPLDEAEKKIKILEKKSRGSPLETIHVMSKSQLDVLHHHRLGHHFLALEREFFPGDAATAAKARLIQTLFHRKGMTMLLASCDPSTVPTCINTMYRTCDMLIKDPLQGAIGPLDEAEKKIEILEEQLRRRSAWETIEQLATVLANLNKRVHAVAVNHEAAPDVEHDEE